MASAALTVLLSGVSFLRHVFRVIFRRIVHSLPDEIRFWLSVLAFWPTVLVNRLRCMLSPSRRLWDRVDPAIVLGSVPLHADDVRTLHHPPFMTRGVVNMCREWRRHSRLYSELRVNELWLPTIDYDIPLLDDVLAACVFIRAHELRGETTFVHCKAGRGRSTVIVLCYLVLFRGLLPQDADAMVRSARPQISMKWKEPVVQQCAVHRDSMVRDIAARLATQLRSSPNGNDGAVTPDDPR